MNIDLRPERLKKLSEDMRFKLWWGLAHALPQEELVKLNSELGAAFFPPDKVDWIVSNKPQTWGTK